MRTSTCLRLSGYPRPIALPPNLRHRTSPPSPVPNFPLRGRLVRRDFVEGEFAEQNVFARSCETGTPVLAECHTSGQRKGQHIGSIMHVAQAFPVAGERPIRSDEFEIKAADPGALRRKAFGFVVETDVLVAWKKRCQACHGLAFLGVGQR